MPKIPVVNQDDCISCGLCAEKCPKKVPDEYNMGLAKRKSAYLSYAQAVPPKYAIEKASCIYFKKGGKCKACEKFCPTGESFALRLHNGEVPKELGQTDAGFDKSNL